MTYDELLEEADRNNIITKEKSLPVSKGRIKGNRIAIKKGLSETEKKCVLAEELGHHYTSSGNILDMNSTNSRKQELHARLWAYDLEIGLYGILKSYKAGCKTKHEMADHLCVTEQFLQDALDAYREKYGLCRHLDNYLIYFDPLGVLELYK